MPTPPIDPPPPTAGTWVTDWLSEPRFRVFLDAAGDDPGAALRLYEWNTRLSAALVHDTAHFEVGLRNAYDRALTAYLPATRHWTAEGDVVFAPIFRMKKGRKVDVNERRRDELNRALRFAGGRGASPGKVIAQLNLGFWRYLTSSAHEVSIWRPALHHAYPSGTRRTDVDGAIGRLHELRNRIAHHEPLLTRDIVALHDDLLHIAGLLNRNLCAYISHHSEVRGILARRPD